VETNDYESDQKFGHWLRDQRICAGFNLKQASLKLGIPLERLKALEMGYAIKGITRSESEKVSAAYKIVLRDFLSRASGNI